MRLWLVPIRTGGVVAEIGRLRRIIEDAVDPQATLPVLAERVTRSSRVHRSSIAVWRHPNG